jgi:RNA polymerase sigma factor (sigma-70 family)
MEAATAARVTRERARRLGPFSRGSSDADLVLRLRAGDDTAFETIYDRHHRGILAFCRHMLGSQEEAEDAVQHVFLAVHRNLRESDKDVVLKPWLYAVARNRCLNMLAARRERTSLDDIAEPSTDGLAVAAAVERRADLQALLGDIAQLPDDQRAALLLAELGDLSHDEIAASLDVRRDKVKALVYQARTSLMTAREARDTDCRAIQEQLATMRGADLRRVTLRKHVAMCPECAAFKAEVRRQRAALALVLPIAPAAALKGSVLSAVLGGGSAGATGLSAGGGGVVAAGIAKTIATVAVIGAVGGGGVVAINHFEHARHHGTPKVVPAAHAAQSSSTAESSSAAASAQRDAHRTTAARHRAAVPATRRHGKHGAASSNATPDGKATPGSAHNAHGQQTAASHGLKLGKATHPAGTPVRAHGTPVKPVHPAHPAKPVPPVKPTRSKPTTESGQGATVPADGHGKPSTAAQHTPQGTGAGETSTTPAG